MATALVLSLASSSAMALPGLDLWAGGYSWNTEYAGGVSATADGTPLELDMQKTLGLKDSSDNVIWAAFEHPIPVIPNIQVKLTELETKGTGSLSQNITFGGETVQATQDLNSTLNLNHTDVTAYWGLPLPIVTIDFGVNIRMFDDGSQITINEATAPLDYPIPMLFGRVGASLPLTGLEVMAEGNYIGYGDTNHMDYQLLVRYTLPVVPVLDINLEAGYRSFELNIDPTDFDGDEDDLTADIDMSGIFFGVSLHL